MRKQNRAIANYAAPFLPLRKGVRPLRGEWPKAEGVLGYLSTSNRTLAIQGSIAAKLQNSNCRGIRHLRRHIASRCKRVAPTRRVANSY